MAITNGVKKIDQKELKVMDEIKGVKYPSVIDEQSRESASGIIIDLKGKRAKIVEYWKPIKDKAYQAHKEITAKEKEMLNAVDSIINKIDGDIKKYLREQDRKRQEAEAAAAAERKRLEDEEKKKQQKALDKAVAKGDKEKAKAILNTEVIVPEVPVNVENVSKTVNPDQGLAIARKEKFVEITDEKAFLKFVADNGLVNLVEIKTNQVKKWVDITGAKDVPGVRIYEDFATTYRQGK